MSKETLDQLLELGQSSLRELESPDGILASGKDEAYGCVFGRDSLIVALELLSANRRKHNAYYLELVSKILRSLANLQGRHTNIESGEEPGKIIHEYRPSKHEHLTKLLEDPWFVYPEGVMRNYDSVDATPLFLIAVDEYSQAIQKLHHSGEINTTPTPAWRTFVAPETEQLMPAVRAALRWLESFDGFASYQFHPNRTYGGLRTQSWMDSTESVFYEHQAGRPPYPLAPVEVQAYAWSAFKRWGKEERAAALKKSFNEAFAVRGPKSFSLAYAIDGKGMQLRAARSSMGHVLWAAHRGECIVEQSSIEPLRRRLLARDLFVPKAGVRTLSSRSPHFDPMSYHNGSIWPHDTALLAEGLENFGYHADAKRVREALLHAYVHFNTAIELFAYQRGIREYAPQNGHRACRTQAWSAAALVSILS